MNYLFSGRDQQSFELIFKRTLLPQGVVEANRINVFKGKVDRYMREEGIDGYACTFS